MEAEKRLYLVTVAPHTNREDDENLYVIAESMKQAYDKTIDYIKNQDKEIVKVEDCGAIDIE